MARRETRFRRSPHQVLYWRGGSLIAFNYATAGACRIAPRLCSLLDYCGEWRTALELEPYAPVPGGAALHALLARLVALRLLLRSDRPEDPRDLAMARLASWNPEAGFFHSATRDVQFWSRGVATRRSRQKARVERLPRPVKRYPGSPVVRLPRMDVSTAFARVALARRTWRRFSKAPITSAELGTLLGLTGGVQKWVHSNGQRLALKTSPSGGARHPIELYAVARNVKGIQPGTYHYAADAHALERIGPIAPAERLNRYFPSSRYFARAAAVVFFTAVFDRQLWRYPYSRAYRAALVEAGHVCQTFCLTAVSLQLAPFCLMGLADSVIEKDLHIDGIGEAVVYAAGVGRPPAGSTWAPLTRGTLQVRTNRRM